MPAGKYVNVLCVAHGGGGYNSYRPWKMPKTSRSAIGARLGLGGLLEEIGGKDVQSRIGNSAQTFNLMPRANFNPCPIPVGFASWDIAEVCKCTNQSSPTPKHYRSFHTYHLNCQRNKNCHLKGKYTLVCEMYAVNKQSTNRKWK